MANEHIEKAKKFAKAAWVIGAAYSVVFVALFCIFAPDIVSIYTTNQKTRALFVRSTPYMAILMLSTHS